MNKVWKLKPKIPADLRHHFEGYDDLLAQLLYNRGLVEKDPISEFLKPQYEKLHDPFLFKDMQKAVDRIWQAIHQQEKITIYGDYDADAVTANAVLRQTFQYLGHENVESYIPDRFSEGYGVNLEAIKSLKHQGARVIITVDCGTNSVEAAEFCKKNGIDLIITDHHEVIGVLPNAYAVINPKNPSDSYPDQNITGVGVAFKVSAALLQTADLHADFLRGSARGLKINPDWVKWLLDLVAIGTVADCHELKGENRVLVKYGLLVLAKTKWVGLQTLVDTSGLDFAVRPPDTYTLGFVLAPRLNAAGRLEHANIALELLLETNPRMATDKALSLESLNKRRQDTTANILSEAREQALLLKERKVLVMMREAWHKGVVGLVAGKLAEEFYKPTFVLALDKGEATGSARTVGQFNVVDALRYSSRHLIRFGGHKQAAGLTLRADNFEIFYQTILDYAENNLPEADAMPSLELEAEIAAPDLQLTTYNQIANLEPFGAGNPKPKFLLKRAQILSQRSVGAKGQHLQLQVQAGEITIPAIAFNFRPITSQGDIDIACEFMEDGWKGRKQLKLRIIDIKNSNNL